MSTTPAIDADLITEFVHKVKPQGIVIAYGDGPPFRAYYFRPEETHRIVKLARINATAHRHTYWVPAEVTDEYLTRLARETTPGFRGRRTAFNPKKQDCAGSYYTWLDNDPCEFIPDGVPGVGQDEVTLKAAAHYESERKRTRRLPEGPPPPSITVFSGGGHQFLWRSDRLKSESETERINRLLIDRAKPFGADGSCWNVNRLLRVAGTWNPKTNDMRTAILAEIVP
jgi:hypothetical protein